MDWLGELVDKTISNPQAVLIVIVLVLVGVLAKDKLPTVARKENMALHAAATLAAVDAVTIAKLEGQLQAHDLRLKNLEAAMQDTLNVIRSQVHDNAKLIERFVHIETMVQNLVEDQRNILQDVRELLRNDRIERNSESSSRN